MDAVSKQNCLLHEYLNHPSSDLKRPFIKKVIIYWKHSNSVFTECQRNYFTTG